MSFFVLLNFKKRSKLKFGFLVVMAIPSIIIYFYYFQVAVSELFSLRLQTAEQMGTSKENNTTQHVIFWQVQLANTFESPVIDKGFNLGSFSKSTDDVGFSNRISLFGISGLLIPFLMYLLKYK